MGQRFKSLKIGFALMTLTAAIVVWTAAEGPSRANARTSCGTISSQGFDVRVIVNRGKVGCKVARGVMKKLFSDGPNRTIGVWDCIGPQTGYAECTSGNRRITGHF